MSNRVEIIMPDAGPLISLAMAGELDTLRKVKRPIRIVDQVLYEVTKSNAYPGAKEVKAFVDAHPESILVTKTNVGRLAAMERARDPNAKQRGLGDAAIAEFMRRLDEFAASDAPVWLVYEDGDITKIRITHARPVHLVGTREFLLGLEGQR